MINNDRTAHVVRAWLVESVEPPRVPEYLPDLISLTARTSQRPAWTLPERWIGMATLTRVQTSFALVPWRTLAVLALLIALIGSALAVYVGASPRLPEPFGRAENGLVAYEWVGDIYTVDPRTGAATAITSGITQDRNPVFSRDGTRIVFQRLLNGQPSLVAVDPDGTNPVVLDASRHDGHVLFSPDGTAVLTLEHEEEVGVLRVVPLDGSEAQVIAPDFQVEDPVWGPTGDEILFRGTREGEETSGIFLTDESGVRTLVPPHPDRSVGGPVVSPDGRRVAYMEWVEATGLTVRPRVISLETGAIEKPALPPGVVWQTVFAWSNDGASVVMGRGYSDAFDGAVVAIVPASDLSAVGVETSPDEQLIGECCPGVEWAPDDSTILVMPVDAAGNGGEQVLIDPATGQVRPAAWKSRSSASWQRLAP